MPPIIEEGLRKAKMAHPIQIILMRQLAGYLSVPLFLVDPKGNLLFYNEPAEALLGRRFDETGAMPAEEWSTVFTPVDDEGRPIPAARLPLMITLDRHRPAYQRYRGHSQRPRPRDPGLPSRASRGFCRRRSVHAARRPN